MDNVDNVGVGVSNETCQSPFPLSRWRAAGLQPPVGSIGPELSQGQPGIPSFAFERSNSNEK